MRRREFIGLLGGAAATWPFTARPQNKVHHIGILDTTSEVMNAANLTGFRQRLEELGYREGRDFELAMEAFGREPDGGLIVAFDAFNTGHRAKIVDLAARYRLPAIFPLRSFTESGGLFSYGFDQTEQFRQAASYIDRILKDERPGDLPVQRPTKFELVINLKTAKTLGLTVPPSLLARVDEVIE